MAAHRNVLEDAGTVRCGGGGVSDTGSSSVCASQAIVKSPDSLPRGCCWRWLQCPPIPGGTCMPASLGRTQVVMVELVPYFGQSSLLAVSAPASSPFVGACVNDSSLLSRGAGPLSYRVFQPNLYCEPRLRIPCGLPSLSYLTYCVLCKPFLDTRYTLLLPRAPPGVSSTSSRYDVPRVVDIHKTVDLFLRFA